MKLLTIVGTRPEAVKMAPILRALNRRPGIQSLICSTGQHDGLFDTALSFFGLAADFPLTLRAPGQSITSLQCRVMQEVDALLVSQAPDRVIVHGDTSTAVAAAQAAANRKIPVSHVEAGLRTYRPDQPWPEENHRRTIDMLADQLFAPTELAAANLAAERVTGRVIVTGNSGVDALHFVLDRLEREPALRVAADAYLPKSRKPLILLTVHRRESIGAGIGEICAAAVEIAGSGAAEIALPVHSNPAVRAEVEALLGGIAGIHLLPPLPPHAMVRLMQRADLILTDSGGIQEEAPTLGKPVLILREVTERPEAVEAGLARLVGTSRARIVQESIEALERIAAAPLRAVVENPYGDGRAAERVVAGLLGEEVAPFAPTAATADTAATSPGAPLRLAV
jgi:UDP-N-acetylglucosamine 2-epimerase (non-hydrolysing)